ncbi:MAG: hypothetical protein AAGK78_09690, partial [Planctomycetota bacterium]
RVPGEVAWAGVWYDGRPHLVVELDPDGDGQTAPYVLSPSRGRNELAIVRVDAAEGRLSCSAESPDASDAARARQVGFDCTNSHRVRLQARDPFPVSVTQFGERKLITIGSLGAETPFAGSVFTRATFMSDDYIAGRVSGLLGPFEPEEDCNVNEFSLNTVRGISGLIPLPNAGDDIARVLALSFQQSPQLSVIRHEVSQLESANDCANFDPATEENGGEGLLVAPSLDLRLDTVLSVLETRGAAVTADGRRAFLSTRFIDSADTTNAAIVVLDLTVEPARIISVLEVGEELARPNLDEGRADGAKLLYVGDQRFDLVYVIDVTTDLPRIAARIESRGIRELNGRQQQVRLLDQPSQMAFVQDGDRRVAFVSNFSNSTLGIIDVTDADPRRHRVIARLGRDLDPQGDSEGQ